MTLLLPDWESLSLAEQVAQLIVVRTTGHLFDHQIQYPAWEATNPQLQHWLGELGIGGVILLGGSAAEVGLRSRQLQDWARIPLLIAADIEEGVGQRFAGATHFPPPMALGAIARQNLPAAIALAEAMGATTAQEAWAIGINWVLAPVVDVNNNPANPVINVRAFGETPEQVSQLTTAFIRGAQRHPALVTAKHFPGHGDTATDSHLNLPLLPHSRQRLAQIEFPPFEAAIAAGVDAVMSAHLIVPALDATYPATLSAATLTGELRKNLGFEGLIVTDALIMGAIAQFCDAAEAAVLAVEAGADILLMPDDPERAIAAVCEAVHSGRLTPERIHASLERIWRAKHRIVAPMLQGGTSHSWENVPPPPIQLAQIAQPGAIATSETILRQSMTVHHPVSSRLQTPQWQANRRNLILVDQVVQCEYLPRTAPAIALPQQWGYTLQLVDSQTPQQAIAQDATSQQSPWQSTLLQLFIRGNPFRGSAGLNQLAQSWLEMLIQSDQLQAVILYGSPYVLDAIRPQLPLDVSYVFTYGQMPGAQKIALEALLGNWEVPPGESLGQEKRGDRQFTT